MAIDTRRQLDLSLKQKPEYHCKRCLKGNLALERDEDTHAPFLTCLQCGREHDLNGNLKPASIGNKRW